MYHFEATTNNQVVNLDITLGKETSKTLISCLIPNSNCKIDPIMTTISNLEIIVNQHNIFQKPIIELHIPNYLIGKYLDEIASKMSNSVRNTFSKIRIADAYRLFEYDCWDWKMISTLK